MEATSHHHQVGESRKGQKETGDTNPYVLPTSQNPSHWNPSWLSDAHATQVGPCISMTGQRQSRTNPITKKLETMGHVVEQELSSSGGGQSFRVHLPFCSPPRHMFPKKSPCQHICLIAQFISECQTRAHFQTLEGVSLPATQGAEVNSRDNICDHLSSQSLPMLISFPSNGWSHASHRDCLREPESSLVFTRQIEKECQCSGNC